MNIIHLQKKVKQLLILIHYIIYIYIIIKKKSVRLPYLYNSVALLTYESKPTRLKDALVIYNTNKYRSDI